MGKETLVLGEVGDEALDGAADLESWLSAKEACRARHLRFWAYHGVLSHEDNAIDLAIASQAFSDLVHLLGADIVDGDDED